jgi:hypothetical protein
MHRITPPIASLVLLGLTSGTALAVTPTAPLATFANERAAQYHCTQDIMVWLDPPTRAYFDRSQARYGSTKDGVYVCRDEAERAGMRRSWSSQ